MLVIEILQGVKRYYDKTFDAFDYPNAGQYIQRAVNARILPPGHCFEPNRLPVLPMPLPIDEAFLGVGPRVDGAFGEGPRVNGADPIGGGGLHVAIAPVMNAKARRGTGKLTKIPIMQDLDISDEDLKNLWKEYCKKISEPFMTYFKEKVLGHDCWQMWVAASMADPLRMKRKSLTSANVRHLVKPLLGKLVSSALVDRMVGELSEYDKACEDLDWSNDTYQTRLINIETFWGKHRLLPAWTEFCLHISSFYYSPVLLVWSVLFQCSSILWVINDPHPCKIKLRHLSC